MKITKKIKSAFKRGKKFLVIGFHPAKVQIVYGQAVLNGIQFLACGLKEIAVSDEASEKEAVKFICAFCRQNSVCAKDAVINISDPVFVHTSFLTIPDLPQDEVLGAAKWQLKEEVPFNLEHALCGWQKISEYKDEEGIQKQGMVFVVADKGFIEKRIAIAQECRLNVTAVTSAPFNYAYVLEGLSAQQVSAVLDIDEKNSVLAIYNGSRLYFVRELPFSIEKMSQALTGALVTENGKMSLSLGEAREVIFQHGVVRDEKVLIKEGLAAVNLIALMRPPLEALVRELRFSYNYFNSMFDAGGPGRLYITSQGANIPQLREFLTDELTTAVDHLPIPAWVTFPQKKCGVSEDLMHQLVDAIAASAWDPSSVNLLPDELKEKNIRLFQKGLLRVGTVIGAALMVFWISVVEFQIKDHENRARIAHIHLGKIETVKETGKKISIKRDLIRGIQASEIPASGVLKAISRSVPPEIILNEISLSRTNFNLRIKGVVPGRSDKREAAVIQLIQNLEQTSFLHEVSLVTATVITDGQEFELRAELAH